LPILAERGYFILAIDTESIDYLGCAIQLARSIRQWHSDANIAVITVKRCSDPVFDHVIPLPNGDQGGYANDWQCFAASPYRQTIKLEADMVIASPIDHWWDMLQHRDLVISTGARDFYDQPAESRYYRKTFDANHLPDIYNAITYWRRSETAKEFFGWVSNIFANWTEFRKLIKFPDEIPSTDLVYAMAAEIMGRDRVTMPFSTYPKIVHMKRHIAGTQTEHWLDELVWEYQDLRLRIQTVAQTGAFHYNVKEWRAQ
jgi:hypothetical protein